MNSVKDFISRPLVQVIIVLLVIVLIAYFMGKSSGKANAGILANTYDINDPGTGNITNFAPGIFTDAIAAEIQQDKWYNIGSGRYKVEPFASWLALPDAQALAVADDFNKRHAAELGGTFGMLVGNLRPRWNWWNKDEIVTIIPAVQEKVKRLNIL